MGQRESASLPFVAKIPDSTQASLRQNPTGWRVALSGSASPPRRTCGQFGEGRAPACQGELRAEVHSKSAPSQGEIRINHHEQFDAFGAAVHRR